MKKYFYALAVVVVIILAVSIPFNNHMPQQDSHSIGYTIDKDSTVATYELPSRKGEILTSLDSEHTEYQKNGETVWSIDKSFLLPSPDKTMGIITKGNVTQIIRLSDSTVLYTVPGVAGASAGWAQDKEGNLLAYQKSFSRSGPLTKTIYEEVRINSVTGEISLKEVPTMRLGW